MYKKLLLFHRYPYYLQKLMGNLIYTAMTRLSGVKVGDRVLFRGMPIISLHNGSKIVIGADCDICSTSESTILGVNHPVVFRTLRTGASIVIGNHTGISGGAICAAVHVEIGSECLIGANVTISDNDFHPINPVGRRYNIDPQDIAAASVIIEDNVFVGTGVVILKGVRIGKNSVIGAGAVITKSIPENSVACGNPARVIRNVS